MLDICLVVSFTDCTKLLQMAARIGIDHCECLCAQVAKMNIFGRYCALREQSRVTAANLDGLQEEPMAMST